MQKREADVLAALIPSDIRTQPLHLPPELGSEPLCTASLCPHPGPQCHTPQQAEAESPSCAPQHRGGEELKIQPPVCPARCHRGMLGAPAAPLSHSSPSLAPSKGPPASSSASRAAAASLHSNTANCRPRRLCSDTTLSQVTNG